MGELGKGQKPNSVSHSTQAVSRSSPAKEDKDILSQLPSKTQRGEIQPQNRSSVFFCVDFECQSEKGGDPASGPPPSLPAGELLNFLILMLDPDA